MSFLDPRAAAAVASLRRRAGLTLIATPRQHRHIDLVEDGAPNG
jgi:hypothetical protein